MSEHVIETEMSNGKLFIPYQDKLMEAVREEIVRCRDCKHFTQKGTHKFDNGKTNADYCKFIRGWMLQITPDGFCAWGERRDADE